MAAWLPIIKVVLPHVASFAAAALPAFTRKKSDAGDPVVTQQISELQEAVRTNAESMKVLEQAALENDKAIAEALQRARLTAAIAVGVAAIALCTAVVSWLG